MSALRSLNPRRFSKRLIAEYVAPAQAGADWFGAADTRNTQRPRPAPGRRSVRPPDDHALDRSFAGEHACAIGRRGIGGNVAQR